MIIKDLEKESILFSVTKHLDALSGFIGLIVFTRFFGLGGLGTYFVGVSVSGIMISVISGMYESMRKRASEDNTDTSAYYTLGMTVVIIYAAIASVILCLGYSVLNNPDLLFYKPVPQDLLAGILIRFIPEAIYVVTGRIYDSQGDVAVSGFYNTIRGVLETASQIVLILFSAEILSLFIGTAISTMIVGVLMYIRLEDVGITTFSSSHVRNIINFGIWNTVDSVISSIEPKVVTILISIIVSSSAAGLYGVTDRTTRPAKFISKSISRPLFVDISNRKSIGLSISNKLTKSLKYASIVAIPLFFGSFAVAEEVLVLIYDSTYADGEYILIGVAFGRIIGSQSMVLRTYLYATDLPSSVAKATTTKITLSFVIAIVALHTIGVNGIIISFVISRLCHYVQLYFVTQRSEPFEFDYAVLYQILASIVMLILVLIVENYYQVESYKTLIVVAVGGVVYFSILAILDDELKSRIVSRVASTYR